MLLFAAIIYFFIVAVMGLSAAILIAPLVVGAVILFIVNVIGTSTEHGIAPILWDIYTVITAFRGTLMLGSNIFFDEPLDLPGLWKEYLIGSAIALGWWIIREMIKNRDRIEKGSMDYLQNCRIRDRKLR